jgi:hypothetical protein
MVWPVMDDIRALRRIEQNVELLVFQHTVPLFHYIVGTPERPGQPDEIMSVQATVQKMPPNGCLVTSERHKIAVVGVEGKSINADVYLEYYKGRVLSGLGMSGVSMGEGGSANKGTALVIDKHMVNTTAAYQQVFKMFIDEFLIKELLSEGGFPLDYEDEDNVVGILFPPIDTEEQRAKENHYAQMYTQHAINEDELRKEFGREPVQDEERDRDYFELILKPLAIIKAKLAQETAIVAGQAKPVVTKTPTGGSKVDRPNNVGANKERPANQHGTLAAKPRIPKNDEIQQLINIIRDTKDDVLDTCLDTIRTNEFLSNKLLSIKKYNFDNSIDFIRQKKQISHLEDKELIYSTAERAINDAYSKFQGMKDSKDVIDLMVKMGSFCETLTLRLEVFLQNEVNNEDSEGISL